MMVRKHRKLSRQSHYACKYFVVSTNTQPHSLKLTETHCHVLGMSALVREYADH